MTTETSVLIAIVVSVSLAIAWMLYKRISRQMSTRMLTVLHGASDGMAAGIGARVRSPLEGISFDDVLKITPLWEGINTASQENLVVQCASQMGDGIVASGNAVRFIQQTGEYVVEFSEKGKSLLSAGKATLMKSKDTGRMIATLHGIDGKIIENAREVANLKAVAGKLASLSSFVVGAAHIVSGADVAREVKVVKQDVKFLIEARKNEHLAKLEAVFLTAKQRLARPLTPAVQAELRDLIYELTVLRSTWRRDLETKLKEVKGPNDVGFIKRLFSRQRTREWKLAAALSQFQQELNLIEASFLIQIPLVQAADDTEAFFLESLPDELKLMRKAAVLLAEKGAYIVSPDVDAPEVLEAMQGFVKRMSALAPIESDTVILLSLISPPLLDAALPHQDSAVAHSASI